MKLDLVLEKSYVERPTFGDCFLKSIEIELPGGIDQAHLIAARSYQPDSASAVIGGDINGYVIKHTDIDHIVGKLLTHIDATFADQDQRKAQKDVVKNIVYPWSQELFNNAIKIVDAQHRKGNAESTSE